MSYVDVCGGGWVSSVSVCGGGWVFSVGAHMNVYGGDLHCMTYLWLLCHLGFVGNLIKSI